MCNNNIKNPCPHNEGVACPPSGKKNCDTCGWNPVVAKRRSLKNARLKGRKQDAV